MRPEDIELAKRYSHSLVEMLTPSQKPADAALRRYGLECGRGWRPLLKVLFEKLEAEIARQPESDRARYRAVQIKEKFGTLRIYLAEAHTASMSEAIEVACDAALGTCDVCSTPGTLRATVGMPIAVRCDSHVLTRSEW